MTRSSGRNHHEGVTMRRARSLGFLLLVPLVARAADGPEKSKLSDAMRKMASEITVTKPDESTSFERVEDPIYRFDDPARKFSDGTIWAYGKSGRPAALVCFSLEKTPDGHLQWVEELTAISPGKFEARIP